MQHTSNTTRRDDLRRKSLEIIRSNQDPSGAYPAAVDYSVYHYSWFRDGAFVAESVSRAGEVTSATAFHDWCRRVLEDRTELVESLIQRSRNGELVADDDLLPTRYTLDGRAGTEDWWDFQLDGYGSWLWALEQHAERHSVDAAPFLDVVELTVRYLLEFGDRPCYDWWEEYREHRHASTIASLIAGLSSAHSMLGPQHELIAAIDHTIDRLHDELAQCSDSDGGLTKWSGSSLVDGSLLATFIPFFVIAPGTERAEATYGRIVSELAPNGGVYRYLGDTFYGGGEWINLTALLGMYEARTGRIRNASDRLDWIIERATEADELPEQSSEHAQEPSRVQEWVDRWGTIATPLLWSHAMFLMLDHELGSRS